MNAYNNYKKHYINKDSIIIKDIESDRYNIPPNQIKLAMDLSSPAFKLLIYMFSKAGSWEFREDIMISECKLTKRSYADARRELIQNQWLIEDRSGNIVTYIIGRDKVEAYIKATD